MRKLDLTAFRNSRGFLVTLLVVAFLLQVSLLTAQFAGSRNDTTEEAVLAEESTAEEVTPTEPTTATTPTDAITPTVAETTPEITPTLTPTQTPQDPDKVRLSLTVFLHGIGKGGTVVNPEATGNPSPIRTSREFQIAIMSPGDLSVVSSSPATLTYDQTLGGFTGSVDHADVPDGAYRIAVKTDKHLGRILQIPVSLNNGQLAAVPRISLDAGDVNGDKKINLLDFSAIAGCFSEFAPPKDCDDDRKKMSDLDEDGNVNVADVNLYLIELTTKLGDY